VELDLGGAVVFQMVDGETGGMEGKWVEVRRLGTIGCACAGNEPSALSVSIWPTTQRRSLADCDPKLPQHCQVVPHHPIFG
jgi:hypothetical protein